MESKTVETDTGTLILWSPGPGLFASHAQGSMDMEQAHAYMSFADELILHASPLIGLHDWHQMTGYGPGVRKAVSTWSLRVVRHFESIHVYMESRVVRMGVAVVNIGLGGKVHMYRTRAEFETASRAVERQRIT